MKESNGISGRVVDTVIFVNERREQGGDDQERILNGVLNDVELRRSDHG